MITQTLQSPPIFSGTYNPLVWMVESNATGNFNFKFVFDVYVGGATAAIRFKTPPNPYGKGIIDVNALAQGELNFTINLPMLSTTPFTTGSGLCGTVYILAGEEYSIGVNGDILLYNGVNGATGQPAYGLYANGDARPAPNATTPVTTMSWGQSSIQYYDYLAAQGETVLDYMMAKSWNSPDSKGKWLTRYPGLSQTIRSDEDFTISWINYDPEAPNYRQIPYAMVVKGYNNGTLVGENTYYNTVANGGSWPTCNTPATGPTAGVYISSFKINPAELNFTGSVIRDKQDIFGPYWDWGYFQPIPDCFPGSNSPVGTNLAWSVYDDTQMQIGTTGTLGYTEIAYRTMEVVTGSNLLIIIPSTNFYYGSYADLELWGEHNGVFEYIDTFDKQEVFGGTSNYNIANYVTTKDYTALGLRGHQVAVTDEAFLLGYPIGLWDITGPSGPSNFDSFCLALYPYEDYATCEVGTTPDSEIMCLTIDDTNCWGFEPIRFSWLNNLGGRDYYTFIKRNTNTQNANRATLYKIQGYWSAATYNVQDNSPARWGTQIFRADLTNTWTASTDWITDDMSAYLRNMFASPHVLVYLPGRSQPTMVTITDASYTVNTTVREKLFQYFVSFTESQPDVVQSF